VLLDLSAAFNTIDHEIMLKHHDTDVEITGIALSWFRSYLSDRTQVVSCTDHLSFSTPITCGVPPGSVLGPLLFSIYTRPLEQIIERHKTQYHICANDTQLYMSFDPCDAQSAMARLNSCLAEI